MGHPAIVDKRIGQDHAKYGNALLTAGLSELSGSTIAKVTFFRMANIAGDVLTI